MADFDRIPEPETQAPASPRGTGGPSPASAGPYALTPGQTPTPPSAASVTPALTSTPPTAASAPASPRGTPGQTPAPPPAAAAPNNPASASSALKTGQRDPNRKVRLERNAKSEAEEEGGALERKDVPANRRIRMRDLPTNMFIKRLDKRTLEIQPGIEYTLMIAQLLTIRRTVIEEYLDISSVAAEEVYVEHEYQTPIRDALREFWETQIASEKGSGWQNYLSGGAPGNESRSLRSYYKNWQTDSFGKQWIFDFFVAFGWINGDMIEAINEESDHRAKRNKDTDSASSRVTTFERLSPQNRARHLNEPVPPVRGISRSQTPASQLRQEAKDMSKQLEKFEANDLEEYRRTNWWTDRQQELWLRRRAEVAAAWDEAERLSYDAGQNFKDRYGKMQILEDDKFSACAVDRYLKKPRTKPWVMVEGWAKTYERPKGGGKRGAPKGGKPRGKRQR